MMRPPVTASLFFLALLCLPAFTAGVEASEATESASRNMYYDNIHQDGDARHTQGRQSEPYLDPNWGDPCGQPEARIESPLDGQWSLIMGMTMNFDDYLEGEGLQKGWAGLQMNW